MTQISLNIEGIRADGLQRFAALAGMSPEALVMKWIASQVDYATISALRAAGETWENVADKLGMSITQARRILFSEGEGGSVTKEEVKLLEKYLKLRETLEGDEVEIPIPSEEDIDRVDRLTSALEYAQEAADGIWIPKENDIDDVDRLAAALNDAKEAGEGIWVPKEEDIEAADRMVTALKEAKGLQE